MNFQKNYRAQTCTSTPNFLERLIDHTSNFNKLESLLITQTFTLKI